MTYSKSLQVIVEMARAGAVLARRFESGLPGGVGFSDFMILYHLHQNPEGKMRRVDLADKLGLTASGITRLVAPMEKLGIVKREESEHDGRVVYVALASGGKRLFSEALEYAEYNALAIIPSDKAAAYKGFVENIRA